MAEEDQEKKERQLTFKIKDIQETPNSLTIISVEFDDGSQKWNQAFRLKYDRPISVEEFKRDLREHAEEVHPPQDMFVDLKENIDKEQSITLPYSSI